MNGRQSRLADRLERPVCFGAFQVGFRLGSGGDGLAGPGGWRGGKQERTSEAAGHGESAEQLVPGPACRVLQAAGQLGDVWFWDDVV